MNPSIMQDIQSNVILSVLYDEGKLLGWMNCDGEFWVLVRGKGCMRFTGVDKFLLEV